jgi:hypothetical protein
VDIFFNGHYRNSYCINNNKFPGDQSSSRKPDKKFENGMI